MCVCVCVSVSPLTFLRCILNNKLLMVLNSLIDFCFDGGENVYITVNNYGARWVKNIKDNVTCLSKQQTKDAVAYLLFNYYFTFR